MTENVFDSIVSNNVIVDPTNPSNHNSVVLSVNCFTMSAERVNYNNCLDFKLSQLELPIELFNCTNIFCKNCKHTAAIDKICDQIIQCCLEAGAQCILYTFTYSYW